MLSAAYETPAIRGGMENNMLKVDLITGFLGAGKTTFIHSCLQYLKDRGLKAAIIENELGGADIDKGTGCFHPVPLFIQALYSSIALPISVRMYLFSKFTSSAAL